MLSVLVRAIPLYSANGRLKILKRVMATGDNRLDEGGVLAATPSAHGSAAL